MTNLFNVNNNARSFAQEMIAAQKQVFEWQMAQMKMMDQQSRAFTDATRAGVEKSQKTMLDMSKTLVDTFMPAEAAKG